MKKSIAVMLDDPRFPPVFYAVTKRSKGWAYIRPIDRPKDRLRRVKPKELWVLL